MTRVGSVDGLPFTTIRDDVHIPRERPVVVGIMALPGPWPGLKRGVDRVPISAFPQFVHGGCWAVNVVYDPLADKVLGVWCNYDDRSRMPPPR
jgi:hypothetical protein